MKRKLFGGHIEPSCEYCEHMEPGENGEELCRKGKSFDTGCRYFHYDPLKRKPRTRPKLPKYSPEDFSL